MGLAGATAKGNWGRNCMVRLEGATGGCDWRVGFEWGVGLEGCDWGVRLEGAIGGRDRGI